MWILEDGHPKRRVYRMHVARECAPSLMSLYFLTRIRTFLALSLHRTMGSSVYVVCVKGV